MSVQPRKPEWTLERETRRHADAIRHITALVQSGECDPETGMDAIRTLVHWYEITGMSINHAIPAWMRRKAK